MSAKMLQKLVKGGESDKMFPPHFFPYNLDKFLYLTACFIKRITTDDETTCVYECEVP